MAVEKILKVAGRAIPLPGDNIDTDRIIPARYLRSVSFEGLEKHLFADDRAQADAQAPGTHPFSNPAYDGASILLVNANFGCGSSREHAPQAIRRRGIRAIVGESYSEIFFGNSVALGLPCVTLNDADVAAVQSAVEQDPATPLVLDLEAGRVTAAGTAYPARMPEGVRTSFIAGTWDATGLLLADAEKIGAVERRLPYVRGFAAGV